MNNKGWVKFWRDQFNHWLSEKKPWCDGYAWTYLYSQANYKKGVVNFRNEYIPIERGQYITSKLKIAKKFGWTYRHVENFLKALKNDEMITYRTTNRYIVVTVINYSDYQGNDAESDEQNDEQVKNRLGTDYEQVKNEATQSKNIKKDKKDKNKEPSSHFTSDDDVYLVTKYFFNKVQEINDSVKNKYLNYSPTQIDGLLQKWCGHIDKLNRLDNVGIDDIYKTIDWLIKDDFWSINIQSTNGLRKHYTKLYAKINKSNQFTNPNKKHGIIKGGN